MLHAVNTQHGLQRIGPSAIARLGIKRLDDSGHILPWQNLLHAECGRKIVAGHDSRNYALFGQEAIGSTWSLAKMNMFLHGEDNHKIEWGDTIRNPKLLDKNGDLMLFDIVTANPPFSLDKWGHDEAENDKFGRFRRGVPPKTKGDYAFISHMIEPLKPGTGRMGVVVPHGVLFRGSSEGKIRQKLIDENLLDAVIGLPEKLFYGDSCSNSDF